MSCTRHGSAIVCGRGRRPAPPQCRWSGCGRRASRAEWGCREHWFRLPPSLRNRLWQAGIKEVAANGRPGPAWAACAAEADAWSAEQLAKPPKRDRRQPELPL